MSWFRLVLRNITGNGFRSWVIFICTTLMAGFVVSATLLIRGAQVSLDLALERLGADIIVVPAGTEMQVENALLMGKPAAVWMPASVSGQISQVPGVKMVSSQIFLGTLVGANCCSVPEMFLMVYDPATDFTLHPWLESNLKEGLQLGDAIGGAYVFLPAGQQQILVYGYGLNLKGNLAPTGTGLDQSLFFTVDTAREIARLSYTQAAKPLEIPPDSISAALIKVDPQADPNSVQAEIQDRIPGVAAIVSTHMFQNQRDHILGLLSTVMVLLAITWFLSIVLIGLVFSMAVNERRREIGVLRAIGFTRLATLRSFLVEGALLALVGSLSGIVLFILAIYLFRHLIVRSLYLPFLFPGPVALIGLAAIGVGATLISVLLAVLLPALRISLMDPAIAMRE